jgi:acylphosphatase
LVKARVIVKGNVQGVGFRVWVKLFARKLGVKGLVRNLVDGSVELFVDGARESVVEFLKKISVRGVAEDPLSLHVEDVEVFWEGEPGFKPSWREYEEFEVDYGAEELRAAERETLESLEWSKLHFAGMSRVFREEFGGLKEEFGAVRLEIHNMHGDVKSVNSGIKGMHEDVKAMSSEIGGVRDDVKAVHSEIKGMRDDVRVSFDEMAKRYDAISLELIRTREELTRAVDTLIELVKKFVKEE